MSDIRCASCNQHETIAHLRAAVDRVRTAVKDWPDMRVRDVIPAALAAVPTEPAVRRKCICDRVAWGAVAHTAECDSQPVAGPGQPGKNEGERAGLAGRGQVPSPSSPRRSGEQP